MSFLEEFSVFLPGKKLLAYRYDVKEIPDLWQSYHWGNPERAFKGIFRIFYENKFITSFHYHLPKLSLSSIWHYCRRNWKKSKHCNFSLSINIPRRSWHILLTTLHSTSLVHNSAFCLYLKTGKKPTKNRVNFIAHYCVACCALLLSQVWLFATLPGSSVHGDSWGKNTGVSCHALLQGIFSTKVWNPGLLNCANTLFFINIYFFIPPSPAPAIGENISPFHLF